MNKVIILLTIMCFSSSCYSSNFHIPEEKEIQEFTFKNFSQSRQFVEEQLQSFDLDEILQAPSPIFKKIESLNLNVDSQVTVHELFEGETKITSKQTTSCIGKYLYIPEINDGVALIASGHNFVAAAHFVENNEKSMLSFLNDLKKQDYDIDTLTVYGGFCSEVTSHLGRILKEENITINFARIFPILIFGDMKKGYIETSLIYARIEKLIDSHESCSSYTSEECMQKLFEKLEIFPCRVVVDCSDGSLIDLKHSITIIPSQTLFMPGEFNLNYTAKISTILNSKVFQHLIKMKESDEIRQEEFDYRDKALKIEW